MKTLLQSCLQWLCGHKTRLARQHAFLHEAYQCRWEKRWMAARRDLIEIIHGHGSMAHQAACMDYGVIAWGHVMVGADREIPLCYPLPIEAVPRTLDALKRADAVLQNLIQGQTTEWNRLQLALREPLNTQRF